MNTKIKLTLFGFFIFFSSFSQTNYFVNTYAGYYGHTLIEANPSGCYFKNYTSDKLFKTDTNGSVLWAKAYNSGGECKRLKNGDFIFAKRTSSSIINATRIDSFGAIIWSKNYSGTSFINYTICTEELSSTNIILGYMSTTSNPYYSNAEWIIIDANGDLVGGKSMGSYFDESGGILIKEYSNGDLLVLTKIIAFEGAHGICASKIRPNTNTLLWERYITADYLNEYNVVFKNDTLYMANWFYDYNNSSFGWGNLFKIDSSGAGITKNLGTYSPYFNIGIYPATDNGFYAVKLNQIYKFDSSFNPVWQKEIPNSYYGGMTGYTTRVFNTTDNSLYISYNKNASATLCHLIKADSLGISPCGLDSIGFVSAPFYSYFNITGLVPDIDTLIFSQSNFAATSNDITINSNIICTTNINELNNDLFLFDVFPNPTTDYLTISKKSELGKNESFDVAVFNMLGECVSKQEKINTSITLNTKHLSSGMYFIFVNSGKTSQNFKIVKK